MFTPAPGEEYIEPNILVNGARLDVVDNFVYLGSILSRDGSLDAEIFARIQKASVAFGKLEKRVWSDRGLAISTKVRVYRACVVTTLLYAAETWTIHQRHIKVLEHFHLKCLRRILNVTWQMHMPDTEILEKVLCPNLETLIATAQLRWAGHLVRMDDVRLPKRLFYGELATGKRPKHKPKKRYKDGIKCILKDTNIDTDTWEADAVDRSAWRKMVRTGCCSFDVRRIERAKLKRALRKGNEEDVLCDHANWVCETCGRILLSKAGYVNHRKSHIDRPSSYNVPQQPESTVCVACGKACKSVPGLKRHMVVHRNSIPRPDPINPVKIFTFVCHVCHRPCKSAAGLRSHLRTHRG